MTSAHEFDSIGMDRLREIGSLKWTMFPGKIGAFVAEMDFGCAPAIAKALHESVDDGLFGYLPPAVSEAMSEACAAWQKSRYGWDVPAARVHPLPDVIKGLEVAIEQFSAPGSKIVLPTPAYMPFLSVPPTLGREIIQVPMLVRDGRYEFDLDGLDRAFHDGGGLLILCNPYNPLGRVFSREELLAVSDVVERNGARVFSDEIHAPLVYPGGQHVPYASVSEVAASHTITSTSASKAWNLPGLKCAQIIISNDADAEVWERIGFMASHGASNPGVIANTAAYSAGADWLAGTVDYLDGNRRLLGDLLAEHLPEIGYTAPEGTYIAWLDARALELEVPPADFFRERAGVAMTDGSSCGEAGMGFMRFIFATPRPIIEQAVRQMADAVKRR
ncbi:MalY/PatB family protein [Humibacter sp.]|uniref:MalY/PatB family protein n=1 Tax=Humibacter sp. TaxID=1940291 RepID=UPI003F7EABC8